MKPMLSTALGTTQAAYASWLPQVSDRQFPEQFQPKGVLSPHKTSGG